MYNGTNNNKQGRPGGKNKPFGDIPQFLEEGQEIGRKCEICKQHLDLIKMDGLDPRIKDLIKQKERQDKFLGK